jgi:lysophospholipase L1-like esterase
MTYKVIIFLVLATIECMVLISFLPNAAGTSRFDFNPFIVIQIFVCIAAIGLFLKKYLVLSITLLLLIIGNFLLTPLTSQYSIKVPKNLYRQFEITGSTMPGFSGISILTTDNQGYRTLDQVNYQERKNTYRIVAIGGSTTQQVYLSDEKTWTHLLSMQLNKKSADKVEVINAGFSGPRAENHFYTLKSIEWLKPNLIIFLMGINDWNHDIRLQLAEKGTSSDFFNSLLSNVRVAYQVRFEHSPVGLVKRRLFNSQLFKNFNNEGILQIDGVDFANENYNSLERKPIRHLEMTDISDDYQYWLNKIFKECKDKKILCMFVNQPTAYSRDLAQNLKEKLWMTPPAEPYTLPLDNLIQISSLYNRSLIRKAKDYGFPICNLADAIPPTINHLYDDCHFNEGGARAVANYLAGCIKEQIPYFDQQ